MLTEKEEDEMSIPMVDGVMDNVSNPVCRPLGFNWLLIVPSPKSYCLVSTSTVEIAGRVCAHTQAEAGQRDRTGNWPRSGVRARAVVRGQTTGIGNKWPERYAEYWFKKKKKMRPQMIVREALEWWVCNIWNTCSIPDIVHIVFWQIRNQQWF